MDPCSWGEGVIEFGSQFVGDVSGDVLGGGVQVIEGGGIVEVGIGERLADMGEGLFDEVKIAQEPLCIKR